ncbi:hypothetical protein EDD27_4792 [Nonomuraea polychroma]|uniref:Uncharacterized protein n=1 Tax=Nonomuraea polychroma TaxID=46176 RepID=A0A438M8X9_9ACTN|nr:hypothetical protein EDD27_4792 [Nonomuraea polychroma]
MAPSASVSSSLRFLTRSSWNRACAGPAELLDGFRGLDSPRARQNEVRADLAQFGVIHHVTTDIEM